MGKAEYPNHDEIIKIMNKYTDKIIEFDAMELAVQAGSTRALNMVMLGAIIGTGLVPITEDEAFAVVHETFPKKFEKINTTATKLGLDHAKSCS